MVKNAIFVIVFVNFFRLFQKVKLSYILDEFHVK